MCFNLKKNVKFITVYVCPSVKTTWSASMPISVKAYTPETNNLILGLSIGVQTSLLECRSFSWCLHLIITVQTYPSDSTSTSRSLYLSLGGFACPLESGPNHLCIGPFISILVYLGPLIIGVLVRLGLPLSKNKYFCKISILAKVMARTLQI